MPKDIRMTVGVQISEDVPVPGGVLVDEGIRVPEDIRVQLGYTFWYPKFSGDPPKKLKLPNPNRPENMFYPHTPTNYAYLRRKSQDVYAYQFDSRSWISTLNKSIRRRSI